MASFLYTKVSQFKLKWDWYRIHIHFRLHTQSRRKTMKTHAQCYDIIIRHGSHDLAPLTRKVALLQMDLHQLLHHFSLNAPRKVFPRYSGKLLGECSFLGGTLEHCVNDGHKSLIPFWWRSILLLHKSWKIQTGRMDAGQHFRSDRGSNKEWFSSLAGWASELPSAVCGEKSCVCKQGLPRCGSVGDSALRVYTRRGGEIFVFPSAIFFNLVPHWEEIFMRAVTNTGESVERVRDRGLRFGEIVVQLVSREGASSSVELCWESSRDFWTWSSVGGWMTLLVLWLDCY